jgi:hypothetical protein
MAWSALRNGAICGMPRASWASSGGRQEDTDPAAERLEVIRGQLDEPEVNMVELKFVLFFNNFVQLIFKGETNGKISSLDTY